MWKPAGELLPGSYIESVGLSWTSGLLPQARSCDVMSLDSRKMVTDLADVCHVNHFIPKSHFWHCYLCFQKSFKYYQVFGGRHLFFEILIFAWKLKFSLCTHTASCLPWNDRLISSMSKKTCTRHPSVKNYSLCPSLFQVKLVVRKKSS